MRKDPRVFLQGGPRVLLLTPQGPRVGGGAGASSFGAGAGGLRGQPRMPGRSGLQPPPGQSPALVWGLGAPG